MGIRVSEKSVATKIMKYLRTLPDGKFLRRPAGIANSGEPDITGCINGKHIEIEVKAPGAKPTALQIQRLCEWSKSGAIAFWADDIETVKDKIGKCFSYNEQRIS